MQSQSCKTLLPTTTTFKREKRETFQVQKATKTMHTLCAKHANTKNNITDFKLIISRNHQVKP